MQGCCIHESKRGAYYSVEFSQQDIFKFPMVLEEETQQKLEISSEKTTRKGKFPFYASEILGNCAFPLSFHRENSNEILIFFAVFRSPLAKIPSFSGRFF